MLAGRTAFAIVATALALAMALPSPAAAQCAMCRSLLNTPEGQQLMAGFRHGIVLLLAAPFLAFAAVAVLAVRTHRRTSESQKGAESTQAT